ncbi:MAG TPA: protein kinase [Burkholderiales bacterium]|nr:protein kinase [Burkholderiales bacterium]
MTKLLVHESSAPLREYLRLHLETAGYTVVVTQDAGAAERMALSAAPDLVLSGGGHDGDDGMQLLHRLRTRQATAGVPFILLAPDAKTAAEACANGANDALILPVARTALLDAVAALLPGAGVNREVGRVLLAHGASAGSASARAADVTSTQFVARHANATSAGSTSASQELRGGTVLFADIRNFSTLSETLSMQDLADVLNSYFVRACEPVIQQGGWIVKLLGDGLLAMFEDMPAAPSHAERALKAALFLCVVGKRFAEWLQRRFPDKPLPPFAVGVGVHSGHVMVCRLNTGEGIDTTIIGDTVNVASRLEEQTKKLGASVVTSQETLAQAGNRFTTGKHGALLVRGRASLVEMIEVVGLAPRPDLGAKAAETYRMIDDAVAQNTRVIVAERDRVFNETHRIRAQQIAPMRTADTPIEIPGYRLIRRLGQGGMSRAFLAEFEQSGALRVLKVIDISIGAPDLLQRFMREYEFVSHIDHPHVARIYEQGRTETHAYIAMAYFPGGDLRQRLQQPLPPGQCLDYVRQIAEALVAIHARGIVHRDLKPDNIMVQEDGTLVLTDFGIAKDLSMHFTTRGEGLGTPFYLSPEQAASGEVDPRSDLYSLGVMFYEMLTGEKPYRADDAPTLLEKHVQAPLPSFPARLARFQPLLDRLMAKKPEDRYATAQDVLKALQDVWRCDLHDTPNA